MNARTDARGVVAHGRRSDSRLREFTTRRSASESKPTVRKWTLVPQQIVERGVGDSPADVAESEEKAQRRMTAPRQRWENAPRSDVETSSARKSCEGFTIADLATPIEEFERLVARRFGLGQLQAAMKAATIRGALRDLAQEGARV